MLTRIAIYGFLYPLSFLSLPLLYAVGEVVRVFIYKVFRYRLDVVGKNLKNSFPYKSIEELREIERKYYKHLVNIFIEGIKLLTISKKSLMKRYCCVNPEIVNDYFQQRKSVILMSSHYNNWEWMVLSLSLQFDFQGIGVGKPNSNKVFEKIINKARTRYGTEVIFADTVRNNIQKYNQEQKLCAYMMLADQNPPNVEKSYITTFMNQPSAMIYGAEYFAKKYNYPVFYYVVKQRKRGYYEIEIKKITNNPQNEPYGAIIEKYINYLQQDICKQPQFWLWSHKRWKHKIEQMTDMCYIAK